MFLNVYSENRCLLWWLRGLPQMQGIQVDPGTSQFRRLWATSTEKMMSTNMTRPDLSHSCRLERSRPNPALKGPPTASEKLGPYSSRKLRTTKCPLWVISRHNGPFESRPLYPQQRTFVSARGMSAMCHKRTFAKARRRDSSQRVKNGQVHRHRRSPLGAEADISRPRSTARPVTLVATEG